MLRLPEPIRDLIETMPELLTRNLTKQSLQEELGAIRNAMEDQTLSIAEGFRLYGKSVNDYYSQFPPFGTQNRLTDFEDFVELVGHSVVVGNYFLLSEWGVHHPLRDPSVLAEKPQEYIFVFEDAVVDDKAWEKLKEERGWPEEAKEYWWYLINAWKKHLLSSD